MTEGSWWSAGAASFPSGFDRGSKGCSSELVFVRGKECSKVQDFGLRDYELELLYAGPPSLLCDSCCI